MITSSEIAIIVGLCYILLIPFFGFKIKYILLFVLCGIFLSTLNIIFKEDKDIILDVLSLFLLIFPFVIIRIKSEDLIKEKYK
ncbi:hypothetical protein SAMN05720268_1404 [Polaribacter sp. KT 15]|nr:hypothetical protein SAMN05720268_1404 [Polaribacter sp. KT 15]